ncbi:MAG: LysR family transcriptional regulator [Anaerolineae bacterium]|nr:LysR family transcriptional regulator [Anaerolineae bacterium]
MSDRHRLNIFLVAAETLNFSAAARQLHMTQPSVSQHIQALEQQFDQPLFYRHGRYVELTEGGKRLATLARDIVERWAHIEEEMETLKGEVAGHLLIACSTTPCRYIMPHLLAEFHRNYPKVSLTCQVQPTERSLQMLCDGEVHFALSGGRPICHSHVESKQFAADVIQLIAPSSHPWASRPEIDPEELYEVDYITREAGSGTRDTVRDALADAGVNEKELRTILTLGNSEAVALAVEEGLGVAFVSWCVIQRLLGERVAIVPMRGVSIRREIYAGRHTGRPATGAQLAFWEHVRAEGKAQPVVGKPAEQQAV